MRAGFAIVLLSGCVLGFEDRECYLSSECDALELCREGACVPSTSIAEGDLEVIGEFNITRQASFGRTSPDAVTHRMVAGTVAGDVVVPIDSSIGLEPDDEVLIIDLSSGDPSDTTGLGAWETARVAEVRGAEIVLAQPGLTRGYQGAAHRVFVQRIPTYATLTIAAESTLTADAYDASGASGVLFVRVAGVAAIHGAIDMNGRGYRGGKTNGETGEAANFERASDYHDRGTASQWDIQGANELMIGEAHRTHTPAGGAGVYHGGTCSGGGGGSYGEQGENGYQSGSNDIESSQEIGIAGEVAGASDLSTLLLGSGGGTAAQPPWSSGITIAAGDGGGAIVLFADRLELAGRVTARGSAGMQGTFGCGTVGSGGGSGGSIYLSVRELVVARDTIDARGGAEGPSADGAARGGAGGPGRIRIDAASIEGDASTASDPDAALNP
jgi:large repetitive protein